jgi:hypothetical protein
MPDLAAGVSGVTRPLIRGGPTSQGRGRRVISDPASARGQATSQTMRGRRRICCEPSSGQYGSGRSRVESRAAGHALGGRQRSQHCPVLECLGFSTCPLSRWSTSAMRSDLPAALIRTAFLRHASWSSRGGLRRARWSCSLLTPTVSHSQARWRRVFPDGRLADDADRTPGTERCQGARSHPHRQT